MNDSENPIGTMVSTFLFILIILFCLAFYLLYWDNSCDTKVKNETVNFVNETCGKGYISANNLEIYLSTISNLGSYEISLEHRSLKKYGGDGNVYTEYEGYYNNQIYDSMFYDDGTTYDYEMKNNDYFTVTVKKRDSELAALWNALMHTSMNNMTIIDYGATVGN